jgi:hypothetical protein
MDFTTDANSIDEPTRRRKEFARWLVAAWEFCHEKRMEKATLLADLISHAEEPDYPLWDMAQKSGVIGDSTFAKILREFCGGYPDGPRASYWERSINYAPVIQLDRETWQYIHDQLGWSNRDHDHNLRVRNFYLWSNAGNVIRFVVRRPFKEAIDDGLR